MIVLLLLSLCFFLLTLQPCPYPPETRAGAEAFSGKISNVHHRVILIRFVGKADRFGGQGGSSNASEHGTTRLAAACQDVAQQPLRGSAGGDFAGSLSSSAVMEVQMGSIVRSCALARWPEYPIPGPFSGLAPAGGCCYWICVIFSFPMMGAGP